MMVIFITKNNRKGQATGSGAAGLVGIITLLIVFYILFLPPDERCRLLDEGNCDKYGTSSGSNVVSESSSGGVIVTERLQTIFSASPGKIDYRKLDEYEYDIPSVNLYKEVSSKEIGSLNDVYVKNGVMDVKNYKTSFEIRNLEMADNILLVFTAPKRKGILTININGKNIYEYEITNYNPSPIKIDRGVLREGINDIEFSVSGVGLKFWKTNEYSLEGIRILADITDVTRQESQNTFYISEDEYGSIARATLSYNPNCNQRDVGILEIMVNDRLLFSGVPDCGMINKQIIGPKLLSIGKNKVTFRTTQGSYLIDQIKVKTELDAPVKPTYYFELDKKFFNTVKSKEEKCGDIDGVCPSGCDEDLDKDCCFDKYVSAFWCDLRTEQQGDRCVDYVSRESCYRCPSGYEDSRGNPPKSCKGLCGDDTDRLCPSGCKKEYDLDCCFEAYGEQYFCNDLPITGQDYICVNSVSRYGCDVCPSGYEGEEKNPDCEKEYIGPTTDELKKGVKVFLTLKFTENIQSKRAELWINGRKTGFDTRDIKVEKDISDYVEPGSNSIMIEPLSQLDIREIKVDVEK